VVVKVDEILVGTSVLYEKPHRDNSLQLARQSLFFQLAPLRPMSDVVAFKKHWESGPYHPVLNSARVGQHLFLRIIRSNFSGPQYLQTTGAMSTSKIRFPDSTPRRHGVYRWDCSLFLCAQPAMHTDLSERECELNVPFSNGMGS
jgi:hypothetical protein